MLSRSTLDFILRFLKANALSINYSQCAIDANQTYWRDPNTTFLFDQHGKLTNNMSQAWGSATNIAELFVEVQSMSTAMIGTHCYKVLHLGSYLGWL